MTVGTGWVHDRSICLALGTSEGGVGAHVRVLAERLVAAGAAVTVCGPLATQGLFDFTATGARFEPVSIRQGLHPLADRRAVARLRSAVAGFDLVHAHGLRAGFVAVRAVRQRVPVVVTWHNAVLATGVRRRFYQRVERAIAVGAPLNLAVSSDLVARIRSLGGRAEWAPVGASAPTGAPISALAARAEVLPAEGDRPIVLAVGRLHAQKGFDVLVDAAALLADRSPTPLVVIAGEGPARAAIERRIAQLKAPVRLLGRRADIAELLAASDVVVMPSRWEGSPLAAHEAMFAARPLVASAVGGLPDLGADGAVALVRPGDASALAAAIALVFDDPAYAADLAARGRRRALEWPDSIASADAVISRYREILSA